MRESKTRLVRNRRPVRHDFGLGARPSLTTWDEGVQEVDCSWSFLVLSDFFVWEAVVNYTACFEGLQWYFIVISSHFYQTLKKSHLMLKMKQVAIEKKYFLKDPRHSGHHMRTVVCSNLSFFLWKMLEIFPTVGEFKVPVYKAIVCNANVETNLVSFYSSSALQCRIQESFGNHS